MMIPTTLSLAWIESESKVLPLTWTILKTLSLLIGGFWAAFLFIPLIADSMSLGANYTLVAIAIIVGAGLTARMYCLGIYWGWQVFQGRPKFRVFKNGALAFISQAGTSFRRANLTRADLSEAILKGADFREANLIATDFFHCQGIDLACVENTYLDSPQVQKLVTTGRGDNENFDRLDLCGINLRDFYLEGASLKDTNLSQGNLQHTNLAGAKLIGTNLEDSNLIETHLTGAYFKDVRINSMTKLNGVDCEYFFTKLPTKYDPDPGRIPEEPDQVLRRGDLLKYLSTFN
jgi:uncharacterized protein YjbI with pentapeptide repeats